MIRIYDATGALIGQSDDAGNTFWEQHQGHVAEQAHVPGDVIQYTFNQLGQIT